MPHFFFNLDDGEATFTDDEGADFIDATAARAVAVWDIQNLVRSGALDGLRCLHCCIVVEDNQRMEVARVTFREAVAPELFRRL